MARLKITYAKSTIDCNWRMKRTVEALGLRKLNHAVIHGDTPAIRGMIAKVPHLLKVEELPDEAK
ncbi:MAG: 50S ribosomal protein L30 [bacterium]|nr:50S ribosomal protein L30 [bacterium]